MTSRKQTIASLAIVGMALFATVMTTMMSLPIQALALGHWNLDEDFAPSNGFAEDGADSSGTTDKTNDNGEDSTTPAATDEDQVCLSDAEGEGSPTEQEVQDCIETNYGEIESDTEDEEGEEQSEDQS
jgi:hypothetical protein